MFPRSLEGKGFFFFGGGACVSQVAALQTCSERNLLKCSRHLFIPPEVKGVCSASFWGVKKKICIYIIYRYIFSVSVFESLRMDREKKTNDDPHRHEFSWIRNR